MSNHESPDIHPTAAVRDDVDIGYGTVVWRYSNLYGCRVGAECMIGPFVEIQPQATIGDGVSIQSHTHICEGMVIKDGVWIGHGVTTSNNRHPPGEPPWERIAIGEDAVIGNGATLLPVRIGEGATVGAGSVVVDDVPPGATVAGNPAEFIEGRFPRGDSR